MKKSIYNFLLTYLFFCSCTNDNNMNNLGLIPLPSTIERVSGKTILDDNWVIKHNSGHADLKDLKELLNQNINNNHKIKFKH